MEHSEMVSTFAAAFVAAQQQIEGAVKDKTNPHFKTQYADLSAVMEACKGALNAQGIAILQTPAPSDTGTLAIDTVLMHKSGEWVSGRTVIPLPKNDPQGYGSAMTYARRYSLASMVGVCPEDDDGEGAMPQRGQQQRRQDPAPREQPAPKADKAAREKVNELKGLLSMVKLPDRTTVKWLEAAGVSRFEDMTATQVDGCIRAVQKAHADATKAA